MRFERLKDNEYCVLFREKMLAEDWSARKAGRGWGRGKIVEDFEEDIVENAKIVNEV